MSRLDNQTVNLLNILYFLNIHSSMTFEELWEKGCFESQRHLGGNLRNLVDAGMVIQKLDVYYITEIGIKFLFFYPNWKPNRRKIQSKPVVF